MYENLTNPWIDGQFLRHNNNKMQKFLLDKNKNYFDEK